MDQIHVPVRIEAYISEQKYEPTRTGRPPLIIKSRPKELTMENQRSKDAVHGKDQEELHGERTPEYLLAPTLLPYLESAWSNSQHYDASRMSLYRYYFSFVVIGLLLLAFSEKAISQPLALLGVSLFVLLFGLMVITVSIRYKERIIRDIRVIYKINELLLSDPPEMRGVKNIFLGYRKPQAPDDRRIRARLSTTQLFIFVIPVLSTGLLLLTLHLNFAATPGSLLAVGLLSLVVHELVYLFSKRGVTFNI